jgi:uncharacterized protein
MPTIEQARGWYSQADAIHDFDHILRVRANAERIAQAEGADWAIVEAAALLHDADQLMGDDHAARIAHHERSALFAQRVLADEGWPQTGIDAVLHCIRAHRFRGTHAPETLEAQVVFDADKLDAIGAIGVARAVGYAALHGNPVYQTPSASFLENFELAAGETHTAYHEYLFKLARIPERMYTRTGKAIATERHAFMRSFFEQLGAEIESAR